MGRPQNTEAKFWQKVDKSGGESACWPWTGCVNVYGYGVSRFLWKQTRAHRLAYSFVNGWIPKGMSVLHHCDNPPCCNPSHLYCGTQKENMADRSARGRNPHGESAYQSKLTNKQVLEIRTLYAETKMSRKEIANRFQIAVGTLQKILYGDTWKHLPAKSWPADRKCKFSDERVQEIRSMRKSGATVKQIASHFGMSVWTCNDIVYRRTRDF